VSFELPSAGRALLEVFDLRGRRVAVLLDAELAAGHQSTIWNGRHGDEPLAAGPYLLRLKSCGGTQTTRITLVE
jgi:hypothetical protein